MVVSMVTARMLAVEREGRVTTSRGEEPSRPTQTGLLFLCIQSEKRHDPFSAEEDHRRRSPWFAANFSF